MSKLRQASLWYSLVVLLGAAPLWAAGVATPQPLTLTIAVAGLGSGTTSGAGTYALGTVVPMAAMPAPGSSFTAWTGTGCTSGTVTMLANMTCTATFALLPPPPPPPAALPSISLPPPSGTGFGEVIGIFRQGSRTGTPFVAILPQPEAGSRYTGFETGSDPRCVVNAWIPLSPVLLRCTATFTAP